MYEAGRLYGMTCPEGLWDGAVATRETALVKRALYNRSALLDENLRGFLRNVHSGRRGLGPNLPPH